MCHHGAMHPEWYARERTSEPDEGEAGSDDDPPEVDIGQPDIGEPGIEEPDIDEPELSLGD